MSGGGVCGLMAGVGKWFVHIIEHQPFCHCASRMPHPLQVLINLLEAVCVHCGGRVSLVLNGWHAVDSHCNRPWHTLAGHQAYEGHILSDGLEAQDIPKSTGLHGYWCVEGVGKEILTCFGFGWGERGWREEEEEEEEEERGEVCWGEHVISR